VGYVEDGGASVDALLTADVNLNPDGPEGSATEVVAIEPVLAQHLKPHQLAGVLFVFRNLVQSLARLRDRSAAGRKMTAAASGCVLAHNMGFVQIFFCLCLFDSPFSTLLHYHLYPILRLTTLETSRLSPSLFPPLTSATTLF
jgi:hypothetical protein